jgi:Type IV secretion system pilin
MKYFLLSLTFLSIVSFGLSIPSSVDAGLIPCGLNSGTPSEMAPCTVCHLVLMGDTIMDWMMRVMTIIGIAIIFAMGVLYIVSAGNDKMMSTAKGGIKAALIGFAIILSAWLIVSTTIRIFGASGYFGSYFTQTGVFTFTCDTTSKVGTASSTTFGTGPGGTGGGGTGGGGTGYSGSGTCQPVTNSASNPCSTANLAGTCFGGANVNTWSAICQKESTGNRSIPSSVDVCADGSPASWGLFQINITANKVDGLDCPAAFSGGAYTASNRSCRVINKSLYDQCVAAATNASKNIDTACRLSSNGTNTGPWGAARSCNFPRKL